MFSCAFSWKCIVFVCHMCFTLVLNIQKVRCKSVHVFLATFFNAAKQSYNNPKLYPQEALGFVHACARHYSTVLH